ncbi:hypothetical protein [Nonomuraea wenchangensis]|uniref:Uncharacterized protein n=1 Tax=Nonomuraea wenchangensis TaxID=568860 RepID=A0A1I0F109_9ACTN|nr:hypothetical protein [Nonomuraea wenchangensis]SET51649.1 hypothetical protein SAMN05421811_103283 [Nonomuraea wenchangensis]
MGAVLLFIAIVVGGWVASAWALMMFVGILHHEWWPVIPTMGYDTALLASAFLTITLALVGRGGGK